MFLSISKTFILKSYQYKYRSVSVDKPLIKLNVYVNKPFITILYVLVGHLKCTMAYQDLKCTVT